MDRLRPVVQPAAVKHAPSFIVEQGQVPRHVGTAQKGGNGLLTHLPPYTLAQATPWVDELDRVKNSLEETQGKGPQALEREREYRALEEEFATLQPAFRCLIKYLRRMAYSPKYNDDRYEYRHVTLPRQQASELYKNYAEQVTIVAPIMKRLFDGDLLPEKDWREIGVKQSTGWVHYANHRPEPHILLFRRLLPQPTPQPTPSTELSSKMGKMLSLK